MTANAATRHLKAMWLRAALVLTTAATGFAPGCGDNLGSGPPSDGPHADTTTAALCGPGQICTVAGTGIAFPRENQHLWELTRAGRWDAARELYAWFTPLLHLDVHSKFIQYIKLAVQECGLGSEWVRAPRLILSGAERKQVLDIIHRGIRRRPKMDATALRNRLSGSGRV